MKRPWTLLFVVTVTVIVAFQNCGTETGNPPFHGVPQGSTLTPIPIDDPNLAGNKVIAVICAKLMECFNGLTQAECRARILTSPTLGQEFGVPQSYGTVANILAQEVAGVLVPHPVAVAQCQSDIQGLSCASAPVQSAFNPAAPTNFTQVDHLVAASCAGIY